MTRPQTSRGASRPLSPSPRPSRWDRTGPKTAPAKRKPLAGKAGPAGTKRRRAKRPDSTQKPAPAATRPAPAWIVAEVDRWRRLLDLMGWQVETLTADVVDGIARRVASALSEPNCREARITVRSDATATAYWRRTIGHEVLHVAHSEIDQYVTSRVIARLNPRMRRMAFEVYDDLLEVHTERLAVAMGTLMDLLPADGAGAK